MHASQRKFLKMQAIGTVVRTVPTMKTRWNCPELAAIYAELLADSQASPARIIELVPVGAADTRGSIPPAQVN